MTSNVCILSQEAALELSGANIAAFLQGQLTCDTRKLTMTESVPGALCNPKGRVISDVWCLQISNAKLLLRLRASVAEQTASILARYAQFSRIAITPALPEGALLGILGTQPDDFDTPELTPMPELPGSVVIRDHCYWLRRGPLHGEVGAVDDQGLVALESLTNQLGRCPQSHWLAEDLRRGHYAIDEQDMEQFTPQALNYDQTERVAFDKGCYTGQEVVARLHYKGQSKRRLRVLCTSLDVRDPPGSKLRDGQNAVTGKVLKVMEAAGGGAVVAAELLVAHGEGWLVTESGTELTPMTDSQAGGSSGA